MKVFFYGLLLLLVMYALQTSLLTFLEYNGVSVNLMLLVTVSVAFLHGWKAGVAAGLLTGLLQDFSSGSFFGCATFSYMTIGLFFGRFSKHVFKEQMFFPVLSAPMAAAIHFFIMTGFLFLLGMKPDLVKSVQTILIPFVLYQLVFSWFVHKVVKSFGNFAAEQMQIKTGGLK